MSSRICVVALLGTGYAIACGSGTRRFDEPAPPLTLNVDAAAIAPPPECTGRRCSRDLHSVLDNCTDAVIEQCSADLACSGGLCVSACEAAASAQGSLGCSFAAVPLDVPADKAASCFAAMISNTWTEPVTLSAEFGGKPLDVSNSVYRASNAVDGTIQYQLLGGGVVPAGEAAVVFLAQGPMEDGDLSTRCPAGVHEAYFGVVASQHRTSVYDTFRLFTDRPVAAYTIFPYGGAKSYLPSATLLLPTTSWGTNYLLIDGWSNKSPTDTTFLQIVAQQDDTQIAIRPKVDLATGADSPVAFTSAGEISRTTLQRGQVLEISQRESLIGSALESNHPVAVFGGTPCTYIPATWAACDALQQQIPPLSQWSSRYSAVPYRSRRVALDQGDLPESVYYRVVGAQDETALSYEPARPTGAPRTLQGGQAVEFAAEFPFTVRSQDNDHPIYAAVFMTGTVNPSPYGDNAGYNIGGEGDPDFVNLIPDEQFLDRYVFSIDHTYANSTLTLVRRNDGQGFHDVNVDCLGTIADFKPLGSDGTIEYTWVVLTKGGAGIGSCQYGRHEAWSDGAFELYVWGTDKFASYGYPAGAGSRPVTKVRAEVN